MGKEEKKKEAVERATRLQEEHNKVETVAVAAVTADKPMDEEDAMVEVAKPSDEDEERLRAKALMPKKHKRLLQRIEKSAQKKKDSNENLLKKRKQLESKKSAA